MAASTSTSQHGLSLRRMQTPERLPSVDVFERQGPSSVVEHEYDVDDDSEGGNGVGHDGNDRSRHEASYGYHPRHIDGEYNDVDQDGDDDDDEYNDGDLDDVGYDAHSSAFTNPSWYGSPSQRRDSVIWSTRQGASSSAATSPIVSPPSSRKGLWSAESQKGGAQPGQPVQRQVPRQVAAYSTALAKMRALLLDNPTAEDKNEDQDEACMSPRQNDPKEHDAAPIAPAASTGLGSLLSRRWASLPYTMTDAPRYLPRSLRYAPTDTAAFDDMPTYRCATCGITLALQDELISKAFSGRDGKAFLFFSVLNAKAGPKEERNLITGLHTVADLSCASCDRSIGWTYVRAFEASQRYKEGKFILERASLHKANNWH